jgi:hypothetical protein
MLSMLITHYIMHLYPNLLVVVPIITAIIVHSLLIDMV